MFLDNLIHNHFYVESTVTIFIFEREDHRPGLSWMQGQLSSLPYETRSVGKVFPFIPLFLLRPTRQRGGKSILPNKERGNGWQFLKWVLGWTTSSSNARLWHAKIFLWLILRVDNVLLVRTARGYLWYSKHFQAKWKVMHKIILKFSLMTMKLKDNVFSSNLYGIYIYILFTYQKTIVDSFLN